MFNLQKFNPNTTLKKKLQSKHKFVFNKEFKDLNNIIASMPGNVYWKNKDGVYLGCNNNLAKVLNLTSLQDIIGKRLDDIIENKYANTTIEYNEIMKQDTTMTIEEPGLDIHSKPAVYLSQKMPLHNDKGKIIGLIGVSFDITKQKLITEKSAKKKNKISFPNFNSRTKSPFSGILGFTRILEINESDHEKRAMLNYFAESGEEFLALISEVIDSHCHDKLANKWNLKNILLVESDLILGKFIKIILQEQFGCHVDIVETGQEALCLTNTHNYNLIILNTELTGDNGFEITKKIRTQRPYNRKVIIIGLSEDIKESDYLLADHCHMNKILVKPW